MSEGEENFKKTDSGTSDLYPIAYGEIKKKKSIITQMKFI